MLIEQEIRELLSEKEVELQQLMKYSRAARRPADYRYYKSAATVVEAEVLVLKKVLEED